MKLYKSMTLTSMPVTKVGMAKTKTSCQYLIYGKHKLDQLKRYISFKALIKNIRALDKLYFQKSTVLVHF